LLQSFVFRGALVEEIIGKDHVGDPQAEEHHQHSPRVHGHGHADLGRAVGHTVREAGAALLCAVNQIVTVVDHVIVSLSDGGIVQALVSGLDLVDRKNMFLTLLS